MRPDNGQSDQEERRSPIEAGLTGGMTLFARSGSSPSPNRASETEGLERTRGPKKAGVGRKTKRVAVVVGLALALLAGGSWVGSETAEPARDAEAVTRQTEDGGGGVATERQGTPAVRPRGLPRKARRPEGSA